MDAEAAAEDIRVANPMPILRGKMHILQLAIPMVLLFYLSFQEVWQVISTGVVISLSRDCDNLDRAVRGHQSQNYWQTNLSDDL